MCMFPMIIVSSILAVNMSYANHAAILMANPGGGSIVFQLCKFPDIW